MYIFLQFKPIKLLILLITVRYDILTDLSLRIARGSRVCHRNAVFLCEVRRDTATPGGDRIPAGAAFEGEELVVQLSKATGIVPTVEGATLVVVVVVVVVGAIGTALDVIPAAVPGEAPY